MENSAGQNCKCTRNSTQPSSCVLFEASWWDAWGSDAVSTCTSAQAALSAVFAARDVMMISMVAERRSLCNMQKHDGRQFPQWNRCCCCFCCCHCTSWLKTISMKYQIPNCKLFARRIYIYVRTTSASRHAPVSPLFMCLETFTFIMPYTLPPRPVMNDLGQMGVQRNPQLSHRMHLFTGCSSDSDFSCCDISVRQTQPGRMSQTPTCSHAIWDNSYFYLQK